MTEMGMWSATSNADSLVEPFAAQLEKDAASKGSVLADYEAFCEALKIAKCPYVSVQVVEGAEIVRVSNSLIDLSSWRALLLACTVLNSKVTEIVLHNSALSPQHIVDMAAALTKIGTIKAVKLKYIDFNVSVSDAALSEAFKQLFSDSTRLSFVSITHSGLTDAACQGISAALASNFVLTTLNISNNSLTDATLLGLLGALRYTGNVQHVAMRHNQVEGNVFSSFLARFLGAESNAADDAALKANAKALADKNKALKEINKKRKKAGNAELPDFGQPEFTKKQGKVVFFSNPTLELLDIACNPVSSGALADLLQQLQGADPDALAQLRLQVRLPLAVLGGMESEAVAAHERILQLVES